MRHKSDDEKDAERVEYLLERDADEAEKYGDTVLGRERARRERLIREGKISPYPTEDDPMYDYEAEYEAEQRDIANVEDDRWRARMDEKRRPQFPERDDPNGEG